jgi:hypothetical protein
MENDLATDGDKSETTLAADETKVAVADQDSEETKADDADKAKAEADAEAKASEAAKTLADRKKEKAQKRWDELLDQRKSALVRAERAERDLAELREKLKPDTKIDQFAEPEKYTAELVSRTIRENDIERAEREAKAAREEADAAANRQWTEKVTESLTRYPDFHAKVTNNDALPITPAMATAIKTSPIGTDIAYELASNPAEAGRIARLTPVDQVYEIGKIAARIETPPPKKLTKAPDPIKGVGGKSGHSPSPLDMSMADYSRLVAAETARR